MKFRVSVLVFDFDLWQWRKCVTMLVGLLVQVYAVTLLVSLWKGPSRARFLRYLVHLTLFLCVCLCVFNGRFLGELGLAGFTELRTMQVVVTTGIIRRTKLQTSSRHQQTNTQLFTGQMPFLSPKEQCQSTEGNNVTFHGLAHPKLMRGSSNFVLDH